MEKSTNHINRSYWMWIEREGPRHVRNSKHQQKCLYFKKSKYWSKNHHVNLDVNNCLFFDSSAIFFDFAYICFRCHRIWLWLCTVVYMCTVENQCWYFSNWILDVLLIFLFLFWEEIKKTNSWIQLVYLHVITINLRVFLFSSENSCFNLCFDSNIVMFIDIFFIVVSCTMYRSHRIY